MSNLAKTIILGSVLLMIAACGVNSTDSAESASSDINSLLAERASRGVGGKSDEIIPRLEVVEAGGRWVVFTSQEPSEPLRQLLGHFFGEDPSLPQILDATHVVCRTETTCALLLDSKPAIEGTAESADRVTFGVAAEEQGAARLLIQSMQTAVENGSLGVTLADGVYSFGALECEALIGDTSETLADAEVVCALGVGSLASREGMTYTEQFAVPGVEEESAMVVLFGQTAAPIAQVFAFDKFALSQTGIQCPSTSRCTISFDVDRAPKMMTDAAGEFSLTSFEDEGAQAAALFFTLEDMFLQGVPDVEDRGVEGFKLGKLWCAPSFGDGQFEQEELIVCEIESRASAATYGLLEIPSESGSNMTAIRVFGRSANALAMVNSEAAANFANLEDGSSLACGAGGEWCVFEIPSDLVQDKIVDSNAVVTRITLDGGDLPDPDLDPEADVLSFSHVLGSTLADRFDGGDAMISHKTIFNEEFQELDEYRLSNIVCWADLAGVFDCEIGE